MGWLRWDHCIRRHDTRKKGASLFRAFQISTSLILVPLQTPRVYSVVDTFMTRLPFGCDLVWCVDIVQYRQHLLRLAQINALSIDQFHRPTVVMNCVENTSLKLNKPNVKITSLPSLPCTPLTFHGFTLSPPVFRLPFPFRYACCHVTHCSVPLSNTVAVVGLSSHPEIWCPHYLLEFCVCGVGVAIGLCPLWILCTGSDLSLHIFTDLISYLNCANYGWCLCQRNLSQRFSIYHIGRKWRFGLASAAKNVQAVKHLFDLYRWSSVVDHTSLACRVSLLLAPAQP